MNTLSGSLIEARPDEIHRDARREAAALESACSSRPASVPVVTIRVYSPSDASALKRLAPLDSSHVSAGPFSLAEIGGELRAALSLTDGAILADPSYPTAAFLHLLVIRAPQVRGDRPAQRRRSRWDISGRPGRYRKAKPPPHRSFHDTYRPACCARQAQSLDRAGLPNASPFAWMLFLPAGCGSGSGTLSRSRSTQTTSRTSSPSVRRHTRCGRAHAARAATARRPTDRTDRQPPRSRSSDPFGSPLIHAGANHSNGFANSGVLDTNPHTPNPSEVAERITFTKLGTYYFECVIHPNIDNTITVTR